MPPRDGSTARSSRDGRMIEILHYLKDPKLWELWYIPYYGYGRIYIINGNPPFSHLRFGHREPRGCGYVLHGRRATQH